MPDEKKPTSEFSYPSPGKKRGKTKLEVYDKDMAEWNLNGHCHR